MTASALRVTLDGGTDATGRKAACRDSGRPMLECRFFEVASDAVVIIDEGGAIVELNAQTERLFGYRRDELLDQRMEILVPERLRPRHAAHRLAYFANPLPRPMGNSTSLLGLRKDGTEFPVDIALSPMPINGGFYVASSVRDMTHQRRLEDQLRQRSRELEDGSRQRDQFLITLAHELANPLAAVAYSAEVLRRPGIAASVREQAVAIVLDQTNFMRRLVEDLGELPRVGRGDYPVRVAPTDLGDVARLALEISRPLIERNRCALEIAMPAAPVRAQGDAARLVQVVTNLLTNAARYTAAGGHIRVSVAEEGGAAVLKVKDDGIGIPKEMLTQVFNLFTRLEAARGRYAGGMGIGLAFARRLMEVQGGSVEAFSDGEGQGSEFVMRLPLAREAG